jgi:hypothetical protein
MKKIDVLKGALFLIMISLMLSNIICGDDAKVTPTPTATAPPEPTPCCPDESFLEPYFVKEVIDPKNGQPLYYYYGFMNEVRISPDMAMIPAFCDLYLYQFTASGGEDSDVCVASDPERVVKTIPDETSFFWNGNMCGVPLGERNSIFKAIIQKPGEYGVINHYWLMAVSVDNQGQLCSADDVNKWWMTSAHVYFPYKPGDEPEGDIRYKPALTPFSTTPTYRWPNQILNSNPDATRTFHSENVKDMDDFEDGVEPYDWLDPPQNDSPGETDIRWTSSNSQEEYGSTVELDIPVGGMGSPVEWTITLNIDDDEDPCKADDDEKAPADDTLYRVYYDHLARDMDNQGDLNGYNIVPSPHYCFGAANHAYNGSVDPKIVPTSQGTLVFERVRIDRDPSKYLVVGECEVILNTIGSASIGRGDWFVYNTPSSHINTSYSGTNIWEFNGRMNQSKWGTSTVGLYAYEQHEIDGYLIWGVGKIWHHPK